MNERNAAGAEPLLSVRDLSVEIAGPDGFIEPVRGVSFDLRRGESLALVGESGCGKSLTAMALMRLLPENARIRSGEVRLAGRELLTLPEREMAPVRGGGIAVIFQEPATSFNPVMTVGEQIVEMIRAHSTLSHEAARQEAVRWLARTGVPEPERRFSSFPHELSGGLKQRAMIAMALSAKPAVVIADEPTTALDVTVQAQILKLLAELRREAQLTLLLITHDLALLPGTVERVALMYAGQIVESAPTAAFFAGPLHPYGAALLRAVPKGEAKSAETPRAARRLFALEGTVPKIGRGFHGCAFASRCEARRAACGQGSPALKDVSACAGEPHWVRCFAAAPRGAENVERAKKARIASCPPEEESARNQAQARTDALREAASAAPEESPASAPILSAEHLTVDVPGRGFIRRQPGKTLIRDVSFELRRGETLALVGESGSGKTTAAMAALGLLPPYLSVAGTVTLAGGAQPAASPRSQAFRKAVQIVFQDPFSSLDPRMTVRALLDEPFSALMPEMMSCERLERMKALLAETGLEASALERYPHEFSGGQRQRIAIARALAAEPRVIVCDEPTSALDVSVQAQILNLLMRLKVERGLSYLLITHNFGVVEFAADRIAVMKDGRIVETGPARDVLEHPQTAYAKMLLASVPRL